MIKRAVSFVGGSVGAAAVLGLGYLTLNWYRYGRASLDGPSDPLLDRFLPDFEVIERHEVLVMAPVYQTFAAACAIDFQASRLVRALVGARGLALGSARTGHRTTTTLEDFQAMGWERLAEDPGHEIVLGTVTQPWLANVRFQPVAAADFAAFAAPGYVKIVFSLAAEPRGVGKSLFRTETRAAATDAAARRRFRRYWAFVSPGVRMVRRELLRLVRHDAEVRHRVAIGRA